jgi:hypothetical protein
MANYALPNLVIAVDNLAQALINEINAGHVADVQQARNAAEEIYFTYYIDLYHFAEMVDTHVPGATAQAQAVMHEVSWSMYEAHGASVPNDHGLSTYFPRVEGDYLASYDNTAFASDTQWNEFLKRYYEGPELVCDGTDTSCGIYPNCENCNVDDGCYPYGNGCEERDYYCVSNDVGCGYTLSNRHTDDWEDTGNTDWVPDPGNECQEKERKEQEYRDYYCSGGACTYSVTGTQWVDTGNTRNKPDGTICGCTASNTLKRCYSGVCTDTGICDSTTCGADASCDGKEPGDSCGGGICDSNCKCGGQAVGEDYGVFRSGRWYIDTDGDQKTNIYFRFGDARDLPVVGDFNGDRTDDYGVFREGHWSRWYIDTNFDQRKDIFLMFGDTGDLPVVGDFNGDGIDDYGVFRGGRWYIDTNFDQRKDISFVFGDAGDLPIVGDFNGDGTDDYGVFREGHWSRWYIDTNFDQRKDITLVFGDTGDLPVVGDFNGDGIDDYGVFRGGRWYIDTNFDQRKDIFFVFGDTGDQPLVYGG